MSFLKALFKNTTGGKDPTDGQGDDTADTDAADAATDGDPAAMDDETTANDDLSAPIKVLPVPVPTTVLIPDGHVPPDSVRSVDWSRDRKGSCLIVGLDSGLIWWLNAENHPLGGAFWETQIMMSGEAPVNCWINSLRFRPPLGRNRPDDRRILLATADSGVIRLFDFHPDHGLISGIASLKSAAADNRTLTGGWSPDGRFAAINSGPGGELRLYRLEPEKLVPVDVSAAATPPTTKQHRFRFPTGVTGLQFIPASPSTTRILGQTQWHPSGDWIIGLSELDSRATLSFFRVDWLSPEQPTIGDAYHCDLDGRITAAAFSPNGRKLATGDCLGQVAIHEFTVNGDGWPQLSPQRDGRPLIDRRHAHVKGDVLCLDWSPQGDIIASGGEDKTVRLWYASDGKMAQIVKRFHEEVMAVRFSPAGDALLVDGNNESMADEDQRRLCPCILRFGRPLDWDSCYPNGLKPDWLK